MCLSYPVVYNIYLIVLFKETYFPAFLSFYLSTCENKAIF